MCVGDHWRWADPEHPEEGETQWALMWNRSIGEVFAVQITRDGRSGRILLIATIKSEQGRAEMLEWLEARAKDDPSERYAFVDLVHHIVWMKELGERRELAGFPELTNTTYCVLERAAEERDVTVPVVLASFDADGLTMDEGLRRHDREQLDLRDDERAAQDPQFARDLAARRKHRAHQDRQRRWTGRCLAVLDRVINAIDSRAARHARGD